MVYLYATKKILRGDEIIDPKVEPIFETDPKTARSLDALKSARPATKAEIDAYNERNARANGLDVVEAPAKAQAKGD